MVPFSCRPPVRRQTKKSSTISIVDKRQQVYGKSREEDQPNENPGELPVIRESSLLYKCFFLRITISIVVTWKVMQDNTRVSNKQVSDGHIARGWKKRLTTHGAFLAEEGSFEIGWISAIGYVGRKRRRFEFHRWDAARQSVAMQVD